MNFSFLSSLLMVIPLFSGFAIDVQQLKLRFIPHQKDKQISGSVRRIADFEKDMYVIDEINSMRELMFLEIYGREYFNKRPSDFQVKDHIIHNILGYYGQHDRYVSWNIIAVENLAYKNGRSLPVPVLKNASSQQEIQEFIDKVNNNDRIIGYIAYDIYNDNGTMKSDWANFYVKENFRLQGVEELILRAYIDTIKSKDVQIVNWSYSDYTKLNSNPSSAIYTILPKYGFDIRNMRKYKESKVKGTVFYYNQMDAKDLYGINI